MLTLEKVDHFVFLDDVSASEPALFMDLNGNGQMGDVLQLLLARTVDITLNFDSARLHMIAEVEDENERFAWKAFPVANTQDVDLELTNSGIVIGGITLEFFDPIGEPTELKLLA